jgi:hypothetical protein
MRTRRHLPACVVTTGLALFTFGSVLPAVRAGQEQVSLPRADGSLKFAMFADSGTAARAQAELAEQMARVRGAFPYEFVLLAGGNVYGGQRPQDFVDKFEVPYQPLLDAGVRFHAALGEGDDPNQRFYKHFNMSGKSYYSFKAPQQNVRFFALDTTNPDPAQVTWLENELKTADEAWKIAYFHQPLYSSVSGNTASRKLRAVLEPLFVKYNVSVVFTGHDHHYERIAPQKGIAHFVVGSAGKLSRGKLDPRSPLTARAFDADHTFLVAEIVGDEMYFNAISRTGQVVDSGVIPRRKDAAAAPGVK